MKFKALVLTAALGLAATVTYGQGILIWNIGNSTAGTGATSGGLVYTNNLAGNALGLFDGVNRNVGIEVFAGNGSPSSSLGTFTALNDSKGYTGFDYGKFQAGNAINVPGVAAGGTATIRLDMWYDNAAGNLFASYAAAQAGGGSWGTVTFENPTSNPGGVPPSPDQQLTGMPAITLAPVPEPSTMVLTGLGVGALWLLRRRK
jgi:hypothetical protein